MLYKQVLKQVEHRGALYLLIAACISCYFVSYRELVPNPSVATVYNDESGAKDSNDTWSFRRTMFCKASQNEKTYNKETDEEIHQRFDVLRSLIADPNSTFGWDDYCKTFDASFFDLDKRAMSWGGTGIHAIHTDCSLLTRDFVLPPRVAFTELDEMDQRKRIYERACKVHMLWKMRFDKFIRGEINWDDDALVEQFFNDLRKLQRRIQGTDKLPEAQPPQINNGMAFVRRFIFIMKNEKIGPVCLPMKTGTTNWQKALGAVYLNQLDPRVVIDSAELNTKDHLVPRYYESYNNLAKRRHVIGLDFSRCIRDTFNKIQQNDDFVSWINTRHPLSRLLSGWNQKFDVNYHTYEKYMNSFKAKTDPFEDHTGHTSLDPNHGVSFRAFIAYLMSKESIKIYAKFNGHWKSVFSSCLPCSINRHNSLSFFDVNVLKK